MFASFRRCCALMILVLWTTQAWGAGLPPNAPLPPNAALQYWQAFAVFPTLDAAQQKLSGDWKTVPLDGQALKLLESCHNSLVQLHRGSAMPQCDWGLNWEDGFGLLLPHLGKGRNLARVALLDARRKFSDKDAAGAIDQIGDILVMARRLGGDPIMISVLVQDAIEAECVDLLEMHLGELDAATLQRLQQRIASLPQAVRIRTAAEQEREWGLGLIVRRLQAAAKADPAQRDQLVHDALSSDQQLLLSYVAAGGTPEKAIAALEELRPFFDQLAAALELPPGQFHPRLQALQSQYMDKLFAKPLLPAFGRFYDKHLLIRTRLALLDAAIAIRLSTPEDQLPKFKDPAGDGPFEIELRPDGFELQSVLLEKAERVRFNVQAARK